MVNSIKMVVDDILNDTNMRSIIMDNTEYDCRITMVGEDCRYTLGYRTKDGVKPIPGYPTFASKNALRCDVLARCHNGIITAIGVIIGRAGDRTFTEALFDEAVKEKIADGNALHVRFYNAEGAVFENINDRQDIHNCAHFVNLETHRDNITYNDVKNIYGLKYRLLSDCYEGNIKKILIYIDNQK